MYYKTYSWKVVILGHLYNKLTRVINWLQIQKCRLSNNVTYEVVNVISLKQPLSLVSIFSKLFLRDSAYWEHTVAFEYSLAYMRTLFYIGTHLSPLSRVDICQESLRSAWYFCCDIYSSITQVCIICITFLSRNKYFRLSFHPFVIWNVRRIYVEHFFS